VAVLLQTYIDSLHNGDKLLKDNIFSEINKYIFLETKASVYIVFVMHDQMEFEKQLN
jgi:hypothetical protein